MPYPKHLINEGEQVALDLNPHWWYFSKHILTGIPLALALVGVLALDGDTRKYLGYAWGALAVVWALWLMLKFLSWRFTHFVVTSDRIIYRHGVLAKRGIEIPLERINNINFEQGIFERIIGAGDLQIDSAGKEGQSYFTDIRHPDGVQQEIYRQMEGYDKKKAGWSTPKASASDELEKLAGLRDKGVISAEEFEAKKADLLERM
ncbi:MAG: PH domain-containing protein [Actinobacteria bacterium]|nr:PH domain-containing protein [Actinomycetota bacterium]